MPRPADTPPPYLIDAEANGVHVLAHLPLPPPVLLDEAHQEGAAALPVLLVLVLFLQLDQVLRVHPERVCRQTGAASVTQHTTHGIPARQVCWGGGGCWVGGEGRGEMTEEPETRAGEGVHFSPRNRVVRAEAQISFGSAVTSPTLSSPHQALTQGSEMARMAWLGRLGD